MKKLNLPTAILSCAALFALPVRALEENEFTVTANAACDFFVTPQLENECNKKLTLTLQRNAQMSFCKENEIASLIKITKPTICISHTMYVTCELSGLFWCNNFI